MITRLNGEQFSLPSLLQLSTDTAMGRTEVALETQSAWSRGREQLDPTMVDWEGDSGRHRNQHISTHGFWERPGSM